MRQRIALGFKHDEDDKDFWNKLRETDDPNWIPDQHKEIIKVFIKNKNQALLHCKSKNDSIRKYCNNFLKGKGKGK